MINVREVLRICTEFGNSLPDVEISFDDLDFEKLSYVLIIDTDQIFENNDLETPAPKGSTVTTALATTRDALDQCVDLYENYDILGLFSISKEYDERIQSLITEKE